MDNTAAYIKEQIRDLVPLSGSLAKDSIIGFWFQDSTQMWRVDLGFCARLDYAR